MSILGLKKPVRLNRIKLSDAPHPCTSTHVLWRGSPGTILSRSPNEVYRQKGWIYLHDGTEITEWSFSLPGWSCPHRIIAVRKNLSKHPRSSGKLLPWEKMDERYRYSVFVTNLDLPAHLVWKLHRDRADAENRTKELKYDFGIDSFRLNSFFATKAAFRLSMVAYSSLKPLQTDRTSRKNTINPKNTPFQMLCIRSMDCKTFPTEHPEDHPYTGKTCLAGWSVRYCTVS